MVKCCPDGNQARVCQKTGRGINGLLDSGAPEYRRVVSADVVPNNRDSLPSAVVPARWPMTGPVRRSRTTVEFQSQPLHGYPKLVPLPGASKSYKAAIPRTSI